MSTVKGIILGYTFTVYALVLAWLATSSQSNSWKWTGISLLTFIFLMLIVVFSESKEEDNGTED